MDETTTMTPLGRQFLPMSVAIAMEINRQGITPANPEFDKAVQRLINITMLVHVKVMKAMTDHQD